MSNPAAKENRRDLICLSHLRWNFVFQRPQHLMTRFARERRVFFFEEPIFGTGAASVSIERSGNLFLCVPHLPDTPNRSDVVDSLRRLLDTLQDDFAIVDPILWYYTPMALEFARDVRASAIVFDCMDELAAFKGAPAELLELEAELLSRADVVFTGGQSLYEAKRRHHERVFAFPSSVDVPHFAQARSPQAEPADQSGIPRPRLGFFGVVDERMDLELIDGIAAARPEWHTVILGPCAKIDPSTLPRRPNIHYLGLKRYEELPHYLAGWDVALLPFARNESTRFISPTKTPEYLAAGRPVVATSIRDVVRPYGERGLVSIADTTGDFVDAIEKALSSSPRGWLTRVDRFLSTMSWDRTWSEMAGVIEDVVDRQNAPAAPAARVATSPLLDVGRLLPAGPSLR